MDEVFGLAGLFVAAFLAATLIPAQSEAVLLGLAFTERYSALTLLSVATLGNVLGSCVNYAIGYAFAESEKLTRYIDHNKRVRAEAWYQRYGRWSLLISWAPFIGDPLTLVAGLLRDQFFYFIVIVTIAKAGRYLIILGLHYAWIS